MKRILIELTQNEKIFVQKKEFNNINYLKTNYFFDKIFQICFSEKNLNSDDFFKYISSFNEYIQILVCGNSSNICDLIYLLNTLENKKINIVLLKDCLYYNSSITDNDLLVNIDKNNLNFSIEIKSLNELNKKLKIGAFCGKFYPPHIGHKSAIDYSLKICDFVYIVISFNPMRNEIIKNDFDGFYLDVNLIKEWFEIHYKNENRIKVEIFDESKYRPYPYDRDLWANAFKSQFKDVNTKIADESYREYNEKFFPECEFLPIDRDKINIHSTHLRNDLKKYFDFLLPEAKAFFKNIK